jgi:hypothetical protein
MNATLEPTIDETLPMRRRRFAFGRAPMALSAVLILALGFIGGVEVQKHQGTTSASSAAASPAAFAGGARGGGFAGALGGGAGGTSDFVTGTVANKKGGYIYVKDSDGNLVRVKTSSSSTITRNTKTHTASIHPGDTVVVQGTKSKNGTVTATRVNASAAGVGGGAGGGFFGGGAARPGGSAGG